MKTEIKNQQDLNLAIASLEKKTDVQKDIIADSFEDLRENLRPVNLIKNHKEIISDCGSRFGIRLHYTQVAFKKINRSHSKNGRYAHSMGTDRTDDKKR